MHAGLIIRESIEINATLEKVWENFVDLTCWDQWNTVMQNVHTNEQQLTGGKKIFCSFRPFFFPIRVSISVEEIVPYERVVWSAKKKGLSAYHEFDFRKNGTAVIVTSSETFSGVLSRGEGMLLPKKMMKSLTKDFLFDLKRAAEA
ncbi:MAG: SRPBCC domain-containing protein [Thermodesulfovibrionales bacterium]|nr:SRPBCC domain-containing protein [Thermodesulfovibrionales bacterium]